MTEFTGTASQNRYEERDEFLEGLLSRAWKTAYGISREPSAGRNFFLSLSGELITFIMVSNYEGTSSDVCNFIKKVVIPRIGDFSRSVKESEALFAKFLEKSILPAALVLIHEELRQDEVENQGLYFDPERPTQEVPTQIDS